MTLDSSESLAVRVVEGLEAIMRKLMFPHGAAHRVGGIDPLFMPLEGLENVSITEEPADGAALVYDLGTQKWTNGEASSGGGSNQVFFQIMPLGVMPSFVAPGPANISGSTRTITRVLISTDGACEGTIGGQAFTFTTGGGTDDDDTVSITWADAVELVAELTTVGVDCNYINANFFFGAAA